MKAVDGWVFMDGYLWMDFYEWIIKFNSCPNPVQFCIHFAYFSMHLIFFNLSGNSKNGIENLQPVVTYFVTWSLPNYGKYLEKNMHKITCKKTAWMTCTEGRLASSSDHGLWLAGKEEIISVLLRENWERQRDRRRRMLTKKEEKWKRGKRKTWGWGKSFSQLFL